MSNTASKSNPDQILEALKAALKSGPPQRREDAFYKPITQACWRHDGSSWKETAAGSASTRPNTSSPNATTIRLISWNIDVLIGFAEARMAAALRYLEATVLSAEADVPVIVFLQEMGRGDLEQIREAAWIQQRFAVTDIDARNWQSELYGTTTLVDRRLDVSSVFRVRWDSRFDRDGLFVDVPLFCRPGSDLVAEGQQQDGVLRLCNTHLESLALDPPLRPQQLAAASAYLREQGVGAALLAGDLNAIQPPDRTLHSENGLGDAYLELGGQEDSHDGYTWGYQSGAAQREKFGCSRMDKVLFRGAVRPRRFERIGVGVAVAEEWRAPMREAGLEEFVTDHYGVMGDFQLEGLALRLGVLGKSSSSAGGETVVGEKKVVAAKLS